MSNSYPLDLPPIIRDSISRGEAVLFLGAGANFGAEGAELGTATSGGGLGAKISDKFLGGALKDKPLSMICEIAKNDAGLEAVQRYIRNLFVNLSPAPYHELISKFRWKAIVTTNYDFVVERAYEKASDTYQTLFPIVKDVDIKRFGGALNSLPLLKLHGSLDVIDDPKYPLILATEEYVKYQRNRKEIFDFFRDLARGSHLIFCGYSLSDPNIAQILWDIGHASNSRPMYVDVDSKLTPEEVRYWRSKRIESLPITFQAFLESLDKTISIENRTLGTLLSSDSISIKRFIASHDKPTVLLLDYLENHIEHVYTGITSEESKPQEFYRGLSNGWSPFIQGLDIRRRVTDDLEQEVFFDGLPEDEKPKLVLLKGHAGSGKTITLKRVLWDGVTEYEKPCFIARPDGVLSIEPIREICQLFKERIYLLIDDIAPHAEELRRFYSALKRDNLPVTLIAGARTNEWNVSFEDLQDDIDVEFELRDLSEREIDELILRLKNNQLLDGWGSDPEERIKEFFKTAYKRQLLVALHEVTSGDKFEKIVLSEYQNLVPEEARYLYLDVCTLNRFRVGVRAGLISRLTGVSFSEFREKLLKPLEKVVYVEKDQRSLDYAYRARHPLIAKYVFDQVLNDASMRADHLARVVKSINTAYQSDDAAFQKLISGDKLADLFSDINKANQIFTAALEGDVNESHVYHQWAVFELKHRAGDLRKALNYINKAQSESNGHTSDAILHTRAVILRRFAESAKTKIEKERYMRDAKAILKEQIRKPRANYAYTELGKILLEELRDLLKEDDAENEVEYERKIWHEIVELERFVSEAKAKFPDDSYIADLEARLADEINQKPKATRALERSYEKNPGSAYIAIRLAKQYESQGEISKARDVLNSILKVDPTDKRANLELALLLIKDNEVENKLQIFSLLGRAFTDGDSNYDAQFWFVRQNYLYGDKAAASRVWGNLKKARMSPEEKHRVREIYKDGKGKAFVLTGHVVSVTDNYCFIKNIEFSSDVFCYYRDVSGDWNSVSKGARVCYKLGFSMLGPRAVDVEVKN